MLRRCVQAIGAAGLIAALVWWASNDGQPQPAEVSAQPAASLHLATQLNQASPQIAIPQLPAPALDEQSTQVGAPVTVVAASQHSLQVGEQSELIVSVGPNSAVGEVSFTAQFDPNVLQARSSTEGVLATSVSVTYAHFEADIPEAGDQARIRSTVVDKQSRAAGGSVAIVQFQAVAPGATVIRITDVVVKDFTGKPLPVLLSSAMLHVTVESPQMSWSVSARTQGEVLTQTPATDAVDGD